MFHSLVAYPLLFSSLLGLGMSYTISKKQECIVALTDIYGDLSFDGVGYGDYYGSLCQNPLKVASMYAASKVYCSLGEIKSGMKIYKKYCLEYSTGPLLDESAVAVNTTETAIHHMKVIGLADTTGTSNFSTPVLISKALFTLAYRTEDDWDFEERKHVEYGWASYGFWGGILLIGMVHRVVTLFRERRLVRTSIHAEDNGSGDNRRIAGSANTSKALQVASSWLTKHLATPSALSPYRREPVFGCTIPTRLESIVVYLFWAMSLILCAVNIRGFTGNLYWSTVSWQTWRYISDRTGIIAYANLPILWMFSGRNNIFIWLTGWNYSTFNLFHRHVARVATLEAIIHSIGYTVFYRKSGNWVYYLEYYKQPWFYLGVVGCIVMSFLVLFSFRFFRHKLYESFLLVHIVLSVALIVALFYHTSIFTGQYDPYLWPPVAIWCFDRFLRIVRLVYCNIHVSLQRGKTISNTRASVKYHESANILELRIIPTTRRLASGPGQHYFLYQPFRLTGWENHPFTLASWATTHQDASEASPSQADSDELALTFYVRPHKGWTDQIRKKCIQSGNSVSTTILLEGPYGQSEPLWAFEEVLLIAGGSGIAAIIPYLIDHVERASQSRTHTRSITLVWADQREEYVKLLAEGPLQEALARVDVSATFYISSSNQHPSSSPTSSVSEQPKSKEIRQGVLGKESQMVSTQTATRDPTIIHGRPDVNSIITKAAASASDSGSRLAVFVCGPAGLADTARDETYRSMHDKNDNVRYFEEAFGW